MIINSVEESIEYSFDDAMNDYLGSDDYKQAGWEFNKVYFDLRKQLDPLQQQTLDDLFHMMEEVDEATAREAYKRGVVNGIAVGDKILKRKAV